MKRILFLLLMAVSVQLSFGQEVDSTAKVPVDSTQNPPPTTATPSDSKGGETSPSTGERRREKWGTVHGEHNYTGPCLCPTDDHYCGYKLLYNPFTNCHELQIGKCSDGLPVLKPYESRLNSRNMNVRIGEPIMIEALGLNPLKYDIVIDGIQQSNEQNIGQLVSSFQSFFTPAFGPFPLEGKFAPTKCTTAKEDLKSKTQQYTRGMYLINETFKEMLWSYRDLCDADSGCQFVDILNGLKDDRNYIFGIIGGMKDLSATINEIVDSKKGTLLQVCTDDELKKLAQNVSDQIATGDKKIAEIKSKIDSMRLDLLFPYVRYVIPQVAKNTDYLDIGFAIKPKNASGSSNTGGYISDAKHKITLATFRGINFAFGTGMVVTGYSNPTYQLIPDSTYTVGAGGRDSISSRGTRLLRTSDKTQRLTANVGISAQAFISYRCRNFFYVGATIGAAFTSDKNASVLLGGSIIWGKTVKVALSGGLAVSTLQVPKGIYTIADTRGAQSVEYVSYKSGDVEYNYSFRPNWFMSLTLNFGTFSTSGSNSAKSSSSNPSSTNPSTK
jgi:hypothetical protein